MKQAISAAGVVMMSFMLLNIANADANQPPAHEHIAAVAIVAPAENAGSTTPAAQPAAPPPPAVDLSAYTGILIDVSDFSNAKRSPAPCIYGPDRQAIYPNPSHVPTPDEVQDESVVRYYRSMDAAEAGVCGSHPLVLKAQAIVGPAEDSALLSAGDAGLFMALDTRLHYLDTWKVGFLMPSNQ